MIHFCSTLFTLLLCFYFSINLYGAESKQSGPTNPTVFSQQTQSNINSLFCQAIKDGEYEFVKIAIEYRLITKRLLNRKICGQWGRVRPMDEVLSKKVDTISQIKIIKILQEAGANSTNAETSLESKISRDNFYMIKILEDQGVNLNLNKILYNNLGTNDKKAAKTLLAMGARPSKDAIQKYDILAEIYSEQIKRINQGKNVSFTPENETITIPNFTKKPRSYMLKVSLTKLITESIEENNDSIFKALIKTNFIDINDIFEKKTLLGIAIEKNNLTIAKDLISQKAIINREGATPLLHIAAKYSTPETVKYLLSLGVSNDYFARTTPLALAILHRNLDAALILIEENEHINSPSTYNKRHTPLDLILEKRNYDHEKQSQVIEALLAKRAIFSPKPELLKHPKAAELARSIIEKRTKKTIFNDIDTTLPKDINLHRSESKQNTLADLANFSQNTKNNIQSLFCQAVRDSEYEFVKIAIDNKLIQEKSLNSKICGPSASTSPLNEVLSQNLDHIDQVNLKNKDKKIVRMLLSMGATPQELI